MEKCKFIWYPAFYSDPKNRCLNRGRHIPGGTSGITCSSTSSILIKASILKVVLPNRTAPLGTLRLKSYLAPYILLICSGIYPRTFEVRLIRLSAGNPTISSATAPKQIVSIGLSSVLEPASGSIARKGILYLSCDSVLSTQHSFNGIDIGSDTGNEYHGYVPWNDASASARRVVAFVAISIGPCGPLAFAARQIPPLFVWYQFLYPCCHFVLVTLFRRKWQSVGVLQ